MERATQEHDKGVRISASEKLSLLAEYTTGDAKTLMQNLRHAFITNSEAGIEEVWKNLDECYRPPQQAY